MIAPAHPPTPNQPSPDRALARARRLVLQLMPAPSDEPQEVPPVPRWQAWLLVLWMTLTGMAFFLITWSLWSR